jgi:4-amino-4-deoxy-L-arabinose transferase-like glycosyltransferase
VARAAWPPAAVWFWLLIAFAIVLRLHHFDHPPDDIHEWRQTQTLMNAASYARGAGWLTPQIDWYGLTPRTGVLEFPAYSIVAYLLSKILPSLVDGARLASFVFSVTAIFVFDRVARLTGHPRRRAATVLFALAPVAVFYGHATQPESLLLLLVLCAAYCGLRARQGPATWTAAAAASLSVATVIKPTALLVLLPPLLYLAVLGPHRWRPLAILATAAGSALLWYSFDRSVLMAAAPDYYRANTDAAWLYGPLSERLDIAFYAGLAKYAFWLLLPSGSVALVLWTALRGRGNVFWWMWLAGGALSIGAFANLNMIHFYYQLPIVPALAAIAGYAVPSWSAHVRLGLVLSGTTVVAALAGVSSLFIEYPAYYHAGRALGAVATPGRPVLALSNSPVARFPTVLYYAGRPGWNLRPFVDASAIAALPGRSPCELVMVRTDGPVPDHLPAGWLTISKTADYVLGRRHGPGC